LEVGDDHKSRDEINEVTRKRLGDAWKFCQETGVRLVFVQLSVNWVTETVRWAFGKIPQEVAVVMGNKKRFGKLPTLEWGLVNL
jgi:hypothetical protein